MGRNRIAIKKIPNERNRKATFAKRKSGLIKKAMELSILCDCEVALVIISSNDKVYNYSSTEMKQIIDRLNKRSVENTNYFTNDDYLHIFGDWQSLEKKGISGAKHEHRVDGQDQVYDKSSDESDTCKGRGTSYTPNMGSTRRRQVMTRSYSNFAREAEDAPLSPELREPKSSSSSSSFQVGCHDVLNNASVSAAYQNKFSMQFSPQTMSICENQSPQYVGQYSQQYRVPGIFYQGVMMNLPCPPGIPPTYRKNAGINYSNPFRGHGYLNFSSVPIQQDDGAKDKFREKGTTKNDFMSDKLDSYGNTTLASFQNLPALNPSMNSINGSFPNIPSASSTMRGCINFFSDRYTNQIIPTGPAVMPTEDSYGDMINKSESPK